MGHPFSCPDSGVVIPQKGRGRPLPPHADAPAAAGVGGSPSLPCLFSNNSNESGGEQEKIEWEKAEKEAWQLLQGNHKKTAHILALHVERLVERSGIHKVGFITLTTPRPVYDSKEIQRRLNSLLTGYLRERFGDYVMVMERHASGAWHVHLLVPMEQDIRTGFDFVAVEARDYRSASPYLRAFWAELRAILPGYGFGRSELLPIKSTQDAIKFYVGKYISKHIGQRREEDKGVRLVRVSKGIKAGSVKFGWFNVGSRLWRAKVAVVAQELGWSDGDRRWQKLMFRHADLISMLVTPGHLSQEDADADECPVGKNDEKKLIAMWEEIGGPRIMTGADCVRLIGLREAEFQTRCNGQHRGQSTRDCVEDAEWERSYQDAGEQRQRAEAAKPAKVKLLEAWDIACPILI